MWGGQSVEGILRDLKHDIDWPGFFAERKCSVEEYPAIKEMFKRCLPSDMAAHEDTTRFHKPGWISVAELCPRPWRYQTSHALHTTPFHGQTYSYGGGGYVADLGYTFTSAKGVVDNLEETVWVDDRTAGVFVEFTLFEPSSSLVTSVKYLYERLATGQTNTEAKIQTMTLYSPADPVFHKIYEVCQLLFIFVIGLLLFREVVNIGRTGGAYFKHFWNWLELIEIVSAASSVVMFVQKEKYTSEFVRKVRSNPFETSSADYLVLWSDLEVALLSFVIFIVTIKLLRIIRFNRHICQMMATLKRSAGALVSFSAVFITAVMGFCHFAYLVFGHNLEAYSTYGDSLRSMLMMTLGGRLYYSEILSVSGIVGPIVLFVYLVIVGMILVNIFVTILMEAYGRVREEGSTLDFSDADLGDFMAGYIHDKIKRLRFKLFSWEQVLDFCGARRRQSSRTGLVRVKNIRRKFRSYSLDGKELEASRSYGDYVEKCNVCGVQAVEGSDCSTEEIVVSLPHCLGDSNWSPFRKILWIYAKEEIADDTFFSDVLEQLKC